MKKLVSLLFLCITFVVASYLPVYAEEEWGMKDNAGCLSEEEINTVNEQMSNVFEELGFAITVITEDGLADSEAESDYRIDYFYDYIDHKESSNDNGAMLFISLLDTDEMVINDEYYGKYNVNSIIRSGIYSEMKELMESSETYFDYIQGYVQIVYEYVDKKESQVDAVEACVGTTELIQSYDPLVDQGDLLSEEEESAIYQRLQEIYEQYDFDITFLTMSAVPDGMELLTYCDWYEGIDTTRDGAIFAVNMDEETRGYATSTRNYGMQVFNNAALDQIDNKIPSMLKAKKYDKAFHAYLDYTVEYLEAANTGEFYQEPPSALSMLLLLIVGPAIIALIIGYLIVYGLFTSQMKTAVEQREAGSYIREGGLKLTAQADQFSRETESKRLKPKTSSSSGGGGGGSRSGSGGSRGGRSGSF